MLTARYYGAKRWQDLEETVHTAITISLVILNVFFVAVLGIGVAGVAIATVMSQAVSAVLVLLCLMRSETL